jgi:molecular chaperone HscC
MRIIGIDLGTTNSACSFWNDKKPELIPNRLNKFLTPSVVGIDDKGEVLVGEAAKHRLVSHPSLTTSVFKRYMGAAGYQCPLGNRDFSSVELSSIILRSLKEDAEHHLGEEITQAVISVPAYFNDIQRKATKLAAELAGLKVERLINEPTAAAMVYGLHQIDDGAQFLILDMGGGTFDVSLVEYFSGVLEVHASSGDNFLGGEDFLKLLIEKYLVDHNINDKKLLPSERQKIIEALNKAKHQLTFEKSVTIKSIHKAQNKPWTIDRSTFEQLAQSLLYRIQTPIERTLKDADISVADINEIVLVGGATRMPMFRSLISKMFRRVPSGNINPDLVVAMGVAIQAGLKEKNSDLDDIVLTDVCPYTLGVEIMNHDNNDGKQGGLFMPIIERNSIIPTSIVKTLCTASDNQSLVGISIYQGESRLVKNNIFLGALDVNIPKGPKGKETIDVRYSYDMNGLLEVDVTVNSTNKSYQKTIFNHSDTLSEKELLDSKTKLALLKFHPREKEAYRVLIARAEKLYETTLGDKRTYIGNILSQFEQVLESQDQTKIDETSQKFESILVELEQEGVFT